MINDKKLEITCRAIILHDDKLLLVRHPHNTSFAALPGGHLEWGEGIIECIKREINEELGIEPEIGRLLYINNFTDAISRQSVEFFFEIRNSDEYVDIEKHARTHAFEIEEIIWASPNDDIKILPKKLGEDFRKGKILGDEPRYI